MRREFEALPWYGKAGQAVMDIAGLGADRATFGFADKLAAGLDAALATIIRHIDELGDGDILLGDAQTRARAIKEARDMWKRASKSEAVESVMKEADLVQGTERSIRTQIGKLARTGGMTLDEKALAEGIARFPQSQPRDLCGPGACAAIGRARHGGVLSGYPPAAAPVIGAGAKMLSDRITKSKTQRLAELMRAGG